MTSPRRPVNDVPEDDPLSGQGKPGTGNELSKQARLTAWVAGRVQGVGFRWWVRANALELGLTGLAENLIDGRVKIVAEGHVEDLAALLERLEGPRTPGRVAAVTHRWDVARGGLAGFVERLPQSADSRPDLDGLQLDLMPL